MNNTNQKKVLVLSNDAGASAHICSIILNENTSFNWIVYAMDTSPASKDLQKKQIAHTNFFSLDEVKDIIKKEQPDVILYGTGWQVNFTGIVKQNARKYDIQTIALIDHWSRYKERFLENALPDAIVVVDDEAYKLAQKEFSTHVNIVQIRNYFVENLYQEFVKQKKDDTKYIVFISEPTVVDKVDTNAYEYGLLKSILEKYDDVIIRLHPTEKRDKYDVITSKFKNKNIVIVETYGEELTVTLSKSKLTIGMGSYALYLSYILGVKTISCIPKSKKIVIPIPYGYVLNDLNDIEKVHFTKSVSFTKNSKSLSLKSIVEQGIRCIH